MWWQDTADSRLKVAQTRGDELRTEAEAEARRNASVDADPAEIRLAVRGRHFHMGSLVIVFGRTVREDDPGCHDMAGA
jgi:hypothetical protein